MHRWRLIEQTWCSWPAKPIGLVEMIGGSYLASAPHISYKLLLEGLIKKNIAVHTWRYIPSLDHQNQANHAWKCFRKCKEKLESRVGKLTNSLRIGHSLGCKLHLLAPDLGRNSKAFLALSFNNFNVGQSIPIIGKISKKLQIRTEFSPSPIETMNLIQKRYLQPNNLLVKFKDDNLDQSDLLLDILKRRDGDNSQILQLYGSHLTPAMAGIQEKIIKGINEENKEADSIGLIINKINNYLIK